MAINFCPWTSFPKGVKFVAIFDAIITVILIILMGFATAGLLFTSDNNEKNNTSETETLSGVAVVVAVSAVQICTDGLLYNYAKKKDLGNIGIQLWFLVTGAYIMVLVTVFLGAADERDLDLIGVVIAVVIILYKIYTVLVVLAFNRSLAIELKDIMCSTTYRSNEKTRNIST